ncbi:reverse transcriptase domain-containing protein [Tanacetum coccineum]
MICSGDERFYRQYFILPLLYTQNSHGRLFKPSVQPQRRMNPNIKEVVSKKGGMAVVKNEKDELIPFSGYFQIPIAPEEQEKTTFTCPYGTFAYKQMPFGLCNAPATFRHCMTAIFHKLIEDSMEVIMDDFSVFGSSFDHCLKNLEKMLKRIEVDKAKIEAISKLSYPTNVKAIRSFLGHVGFYRRFIKDFSQIARPMTQLLVKDTPFNFSEECIQAFDNARAKDRQTFQAHTLRQQNNEPSIRKLHNYQKRAFGCHLCIRQIPSILGLIQYHRFHGSLYPAICDKKGAENPAADHLSRLENPDLGKLTKAEIRDLFPEEWLMEISNKNNEPCVMTESYEGAWPTMRQHKFFHNVTTDHLEDIMASPPPQEKSSRLSFTGYISSEMHVSWYKFAMHVNEQETSHQGTKRLKNTSKSTKYSMFGELTLWDVSPHQTETNTSW